MNSTTTRFSLPLHSFSATSATISILVALVAIPGCGDDANDNNQSKPDAGQTSMDASPTVTVATLGPDANVIAGQTVDLTVTLTAVAGAGGVNANLAIAPGTTGTTVPSVVSVDAGKSAATFTVTAGATPGSEVVTATLGTSSATANITITAAGSLVINEVDYDQPGADSDEFIEIFNDTGATIDLSDYAIVRINGSNSMEYDTQIDLTGMLAQGKYVVIGSNTLLATILTDAIKIPFANSISNLQNGGTNPDGIGLFRKSDSTLIDALSYEGSITAAVTTNFGTHDFTAGTPATAQDSNSNPGSMSRLPNGSDTGDDDTDWAITTVPTPGADNVANAANYARLPTE